MFWLLIPCCRCGCVGVEPKWRDATIDDLKRAPLKCRVRDIETLGWTEDWLIGYVVSSIGLDWRISGERGCRFCQVQDNT